MSVRYRSHALQHPKSLILPIRSAHAQRLRITESFAQIYMLGSRSWLPLVGGFRSLPKIMGWTECGDWMLPAQRLGSPQQEHFLCFLVLLSYALCAKFCLVLFSPFWGPEIGTWLRAENTSLDHTPRALRLAKRFQLPILQSQTQGPLTTPNPLVLEGFRVISLRFYLFLLWGGESCRRPGHCS